MQHDINGRRILNLGAGVQSTAVALMGVKNWHAWACSDDLPYPAVGLLNRAVFADTGGEPVGVYEHLRWLEAACSKWFPVITVSYGNLAKALEHGVDGQGGRFASIPAFTLSQSGKANMLRRQCTRDYKTDMLERHIRREVLGLKPGEKAPKDNGVVQLMGLSYDEPGRIIRVKARFQSVPWECAFPLFEMEMTRGGCLTWLKRHYPDRKIVRSACTFCPYHSDEEWRVIKENPVDWAEAVRVDEGLRNPAWRAVQGLDDKLYLHRSGRPLKEVEFTGDKLKASSFLEECEGACGV